jgi:hypothetical protein
MIDCSWGGETASRGGPGESKARMMAGPMRLSVLVALATIGAAGIASAEPVKVGDTMEGVRNARYCEIIPIVREGFHLEATVYNTLGHNDCPPKIWESISEDAIKERFGALMVLMNGPRYFIMDEISASGESKSGKTIDIDGMDLTERASIDLGLFDLLHRPYRETTIDRETLYVFKAGSPVFLLEAPDGSRYIMQAYAQIVDKTLTYDDLPGLGAKLKLPSGWRYSTTVPQQDIVAGAKGTATVVQDDLDNTYQKLD